MEDKDEKKQKLTDILGKVVNTGITAAFMTEDAVKNILNDLPLPKEIANGLLQNAKHTKEEFVDSVKIELRSYLNKLDPSKEIDRIIENYDIEINAKLKLTPKKKTPAKKSPKNKE